MQYAAVTHGGFLGIGNKMFAVPFEAFKFKPDPDDADETVLVLNVTQQQLEGSVGFDENSCPDFADEEFTSGLYKRYGVQRNMKNRVHALMSMSIATESTWMSMASETVSRESSIPSSKFNRLGLTMGRAMAFLRL